MLLQRLTMESYRDILSDLDFSLSSSNRKDKWNLAQLCVRIPTRKYRCCQDNLQKRYTKGNIKWMLHIHLGSNADEPDSRNVCHTLDLDCLDRGFCVTAKQAQPSPRSPFKSHHSTCTYTRNGKSFCSTLVSNCSRAAATNQYHLY